MLFSEPQIKMIVQGFADYHAKLGATSIIREVSPNKGYMIDGKFYSDLSILKVFEDKYKDIKETKKD